MGLFDTEPRELYNYLVARVACRVLALLPFPVPKPIRAGEPGLGGFQRTQKNRKKGNKCALMSEWLTDRVAKVTESRAEAVT